MKSAASAVLLLKLRDVSRTQRAPQRLARKRRSRCMERLGGLVDLADEVIIVLNSAPGLET